jgi:hypothetical protein
VGEKDAGKWQLWNYLLFPLIKKKCFYLQTDYMTIELITINARKQMDCGQFGDHHQFFWNFSG